MCPFLCPVFHKIDTSLADGKNPLCQEVLTLFQVLLIYNVIALVCGIFIATRS
jgi:hypothetical protein